MNPFCDLSIYFYMSVYASKLSLALPCIKFTSYVY